MISEYPDTRVRRIGIDLTPTLPGGVNGGAKPAAFALVSLLAEDPDRTVIALVRASYFEELPFDGQTNLEVVRVADSFLDAPHPELDATAGMSLAVALGIDVLIAPYGDPTLKEDGVPIISLRYDVQHLDYPEFFSDAELHHRSGADKRLAERSDRVVTSSAFSKRRMVELLGIAEDRIDVIPLTRPSPPAEIDSDEVSSRLRAVGVSSPDYFYYPANLWPHKNHRRLIDAFSYYRANAGATGWDLVLTGDPLDAGDALIAHAEQLGVRDAVHMLGFVDKSTQDAVWAGAGALVFPSIYEGFGIPLQEALIRGKPIAASNAASIPEVAGHLATYFDPEDVPAIAEALSNIERSSPASAPDDDAVAMRLRLFDRDVIREKFLDAADVASVTRRRGIAPLPSSEASRAEATPSLGVVIRHSERRTTDVHFICEQANQFTAAGIEVCIVTEIDPAKLTRRLDSRDAAEVDVIKGSTGDADVINAALRSMRAEFAMVLDAPSQLFPGAAECIRRAAAMLSGVDVIHGAAIDQDANGRMVREHPTTWCEPGSTATRHAIPGSALAFRRTLIDDIGGLKAGSSGTWRASLMTSVPAEATFVYLPLFIGLEGVAASSGALREQDPLLPELAAILESTSDDERSAWLIERCESVLMERTAAALALPRFRFRISDDLIWFAPYLLGRGAVEPPSRFASDLFSKWRVARTGGATTSLLFATEGAATYHPWSPVIVETMPATLDDFVSRIFNSAGEFDTASPRTIEMAIAHGHTDAFSERLRAAVEEPDDRMFAVAAFEATHDRMPRPSELTDLESRAFPARVAVVRELALRALKEHVRVAALRRRRHDYFAEIDHAVSTITPMGKADPVSASDWHARLALITNERTATGSAARDTAPPPAVKPKVSVLCSLYRGRAFIDEYLHNIVEQEDFTECELIVIDAASPEGEHEIIRAYAREHPNIRYHRCSERIGIYAAWNLAVEMSSGEYLSNANVDDSRHPASLRMFREALDESPEVDVVYSDCLYSLLPHVPWPTAEVIGLRSELPPITTRNLLEFNSPHCAPMWRKSLHERFGMFDDEFRSAGDWEFWLRCARGGAVFEKIEPPLVQYFQNPKGISTSIDSPASREENRIRSMYRDLLIAPEMPLHRPRVAARQTEAGR